MAASTYWARLVYGNRYLRLDTEPFALSQSFSPPGVSRTAVYSEGESRERLSDKYNDRTWSVSVRIQGESEIEVDQYIQQLTGFLELAGDKTYKLYFEYYPNAAIGVKPLWGQGVYNYQIKDALCSITSPWLVRDKLAVVTMNLRIAPFVEGQRQRVASAVGMVIQDTFGMPSGQSRGIICGNINTNYFPNPIFNHTTWNNGWVAQGTITAEKNTDPNYILFEDVSVKLSQRDISYGTANYIGTAILGTPTTYCASSFVKRAGGGVPGTADIQFIVGGTALGAFNNISMGNNWYRIYDYFTAPASGTLTAGLKLYNPGASFYMDGFQVEATGTALLNTPGAITFGDELGCSWASTRGASNSISTHGYLSLPILEVINLSEGCIRMAVKWNCSSDYENTQALFYSGGVDTLTFYAEYAPLTKTVDFYAGGTHVHSAALSFVPNDIYVFHFVWGRTADGTKQTCLYTNGTAVTSNTYAAIQPIGSFYISHENLVANPNATLYATILDFTIYGQYIDEAHIIADYAQVYQAVTGGDGLGQCLNTIPYIWTKDGDNVVDSIYTASKNDWAVINGVPGNMGAYTIFDIQASIVGTANYQGIVIANQVYKDYLSEAEMTFATAGTQVVGTAAVSFPGAGTAISIMRQLEAYRGQKLYTISSLKYAGTVLGREVIHYDSESNAYYSNYVSNIGAGTSTYNYFLMGPITIPNTLPTSIDWMQGSGELNFKFQLKQSTGSGTVIMDRYRIIPGTFMYIPIEGLTANRATIVDGNQTYCYNTSTLKEDGFVSLYGELIELKPGVYNHLVSIPAGIAASSGTADTTTFSRIYVTPRYALA